MKDQPDGVHETEIVKESTPKDVIFDRNSFLDRLLGDENLAKEIIKGFLEDSLRQIATIKDAFDKKDTNGIHYQAHSLKGAAANISATALKELAYQIEVAGKTGDLTKAASLISKLDEQFLALKKRLTQKFLVKKLGAFHENVNC